MVSLLYKYNYFSARPSVAAAVVVEGQERGRVCGERYYLL